LIDGLNINRYPMILINREAQSNILSPKKDRSPYQSTSLKLKTEEPLYILFILEKPKRN